MEEDDTQPESFGTSNIVEEGAKNDFAEPAAVKNEPESVYVDTTTFESNEDVTPQPIDLNDSFFIKREVETNGDSELSQCVTPDRKTESIADIKSWIKSSVNLDIARSNSIAKGGAISDSKRPTSLSRRGSGVGTATPERRPSSLSRNNSATSTPVVPQASSMAGKSPTPRKSLAIRFQSKKNEVNVQQEQEPKPQKIVYDVQKLKKVDLPVEKKPVPKHEIIEKPEETPKEPEKPNVFEIIPFRILVERNINKQFEGLNVGELEKHICDIEFYDVFKMSKTDFSKLPLWKQKDQKRKMKIF